MDAVPPMPNRTTWEEVSLWPCEFRNATPTHKFSLEPQVQVQEKQGRELSCMLQKLIWYIQLKHVPDKPERLICPPATWQCFFSTIIHTAIHLCSCNMVAVTLVRRTTITWQCFSAFSTWYNRTLESYASILAFFFKFSPLVWNHPCSHRMGVR